MEHYWSTGVVYELWCLVHAQQQHGQIDGGMVCGERWCGRGPPGSHWGVTPSVWVKRGCSSTPPWTAARSADVHRRRTTLDALGVLTAGCR